MRRQPTARTIHERSDATVMLADISGFTALSERTDPERVTEIVNACFERLEAIVLAHGGLIDAYLGDCVKAVFGFSLATADSTRNAVLAALEIRDAVAAFNAEAALPSPLGVHIGLDTGPAIGAVMGRAGADEFLVMGDTARGAAALEDVSQTGEILVGPATHAATRDEFDYRARAGTPPRETVYELLGRTVQRRTVRQSERRYASILFCDVVGFGDLSSRLDAASLAELVASCLDELKDAIERHGGVVDKYMGDGLMALFGIPNAIEDAPKQAVNAAIDMRASVQAFAEARQLALELHAGINTGLVIAGEIGGRVKRDFSAIGDTVNLASRLKDAAPSGAIYVGLETHHHTAEDFEWAPVPPLVLKGKARPVQAFQLTSFRTRVHRTTGRRVGRMVYSEMVGRDAELDELRQAVAALAAGRGGVVTLAGEPGMGKTRLVSEAAKVAEELGVGTLVARSLAVGETLSFHPFIDLFRQLAGIDENEPEVQALAKLEGTLTGLVPDAADVVPFVATLMGFRLSGPVADRIGDIEGDALEKLIAKSVREVLQGLAIRRPRVIVFEDLHWMDRTSLTLLETLLPLVHRHPLLFVHVQRPHFTDTSERLLRVVRERLADRHHEITLQGLGAEYSETLVQSLLAIDDMPRPLRSLIAQKAEGNPFYIEEVVRSLIDQGAITFQDERFTVTEHIETVVIPSTIQDVIMARVDRLDESKRQLLQVASVIGRNFYHRIIAHILEREGLEEDLAQLKDKQMLVERRTRWEIALGERTFGEELEYIFQHALAQETIYASLLNKTRKANHLRVAETIEVLFADRLPEFYGSLAGHYGRAEQPDKAETYCFKAGEESARAGASAEALRYFRESMRLYGLIHGDGGEPQRKALLEKNVGLALLNTGELAESIGFFDRALVWLGERVPKTSFGIQTKGATDLLAVLVGLYLLQGRRRLRAGSESDREFFEIMNARARASVTTDPKRIFFDNIGGVRRMNGIDPSAFAEGCGLYAVAGGMFSFSGMSFAVSRRFLDLAKRCVATDNVSDEFDCRHLEFTINYLEGHWDRDDLLDDALIDRCIRRGLFWDVQTYLGLACDRLFRQGEFAAALRHVDRLAELRDVYGYEFAASNHDGELAMLLLETRKLDEARATAERYHAARTEPPLKVLGLGTMAKAELLANADADAGATLDKARAIVAGTSVVPPWHLSAFAAADLAHAIRCLEQARARGQAPGALARRARGARRTAVGVAKKVAVQRVEICRLAGELDWVLGKHGRAARWWERSLVEAERLRAAPELARTHAEIARRLRAAGPPHVTVANRDADAHAELARRSFEALRLDWDLASLSGAAAPGDVAVAT